jgi:hypothetical protein
MERTEAKRVLVICPLMKVVFLLHRSAVYFSVGKIPRRSPQCASYAGRFVREILVYIQLF